MTGSITLYTPFRGPLNVKIYFMSDHVYMLLLWFLLHRVTEKWSFCFNIRRISLPGATPCDNNYLPFLTQCCEH